MRIEIAKSLRRLRHTAPLVMAAVLLPWIAGHANAQGVAGTAAAAGGEGRAGAPLVLNKVRDDLFEVEGKGGNSIFYVTDAGVILIDDKNNGQAIVDELLGLIRSVTDKPIKYVIDTHYHQDHTGNNEYFRKLGVPIISHINAAAYIDGPVWQTTKVYDQDGKFVRDEPYSKGTAAGTWKQTSASITFTEELRINLGGKVVRLRYLGPAHTGGDAYVFFPAEKVLAIGDNLVIPFCGVCIDYHAGGTVNGYIKNLGELLALPGSPKVADLDAFVTVIPGHGPVSDRAALLEHRNKLIKLRDQVHQFKHSGKSYREATEFFAKEYGWKPEDRNLGQWTLPGLWKEVK